MPDQVTTKINRTLPQQTFAFNEKIELNAELLMQAEGEGEEKEKEFPKRLSSGQKGEPKSSGKKKVKTG